MRVDEVMSPKVVAVWPHTPLKEVAALFVRREVGAAPVVDEAGKLVGIVTEADVIRAEQHADPRRHLRRDGILADADADVGAAAGSGSGSGCGGVGAGETANAAAPLTPTTAGDVMSSPVVAARPDADVADIAQIMLAENLTRVPVVDGEARLVGIVSRSDLMKPVARPDADIARDVQEFADLLPAGTLAAVAVTGGDVEVTVAPGADVATVARLASSVPGALHVHVLVAGAKP